MRFYIFFSKRRRNETYVNVRDVGTLTLCGRLRYDRSVVELGINYYYYYHHHYYCGGRGLRKKWRRVGLYNPIATTKTKESRETTKNKQTKISGQ